MVQCIFQSWEKIVPAYIGYCRTRACLVFNRSGWVASFHCFSLSVLFSFLTSSLEKLSMTADLLTRPSNLIPNKQTRSSLTTSSDHVDCLSVHAHWLSDHKHWLSLPWSLSHTHCMVVVLARTGQSHLPFCSFSCNHRKQYEGHVQAICRRGGCQRC